MLDNQFYMTFYMPWRWSRCKVLEREREQWGSPNAISSHEATINELVLGSYNSIRSHISVLLTGTQMNYALLTFQNGAPLPIHGIYKVHRPPEEYKEI